MVTRRGLLAIMAAGVAPAFVREPMRLWVPRPVPPAEGSLVVPWPESRLLKSEVLDYLRPPTLHWDGGQLTLRPVGFGWVTLEEAKRIAKAFREAYSDIPARWSV